MRSRLILVAPSLKAMCMSSIISHGSLKTYVTICRVEFVAAVACAKDAYDNVGKWAQTERAPFNLADLFMQPKVRKEPKGTVLIIFPFNFPLFLGVVPLVCRVLFLPLFVYVDILHIYFQVAAIAAGNTVLFKPSEVSVATAALLEELIPKYLDPDIVQVVQGAVEETTKVRSITYVVLFCAMLIRNYDSSFSNSNGIIVSVLLSDWDPCHEHNADYHVVSYTG